MSANFTWVVVFIWYALLVVVVIRIFTRENRTPASRIAWVLVVASLPYIGVLFYLFLGEVNVGRRYNRRLAHVIDNIHTEISQHPDIAENHAYTLINKNYRGIFKYSQSISGFAPCSGNQGQLMPDAQTAIDHLIQDIDNAKICFHGIYYIWLDDHTGRAFAKALIRATKRGVQCRVLADGVGSRAFIRSQTWQKMLDAGVDARVALPLRGLIHAIFSTRFDLRNHRKITVIDHKISYIGSRNIADPEFRIKPKYAPWVDIMVRLKGPIVEQNNILFATDWAMASDEPLENLISDQPSTRFKNGFVANIAPDGPTLRYAAIQQLFESVFASAREEICITSPYFVPSEGLVDAICAAAYSGVKVSMIFPQNNDSKVVEATADSHYKELLSAGVKIYEYKPGLVHAKIVTVDNKLGVFGSSNLDRRSFDLNYENNVVFENPELASALRARQADYIRDSVEIELEEVAQWSILRRFWNNAMAMLSPIL